MRRVPLLLLLGLLAACSEGPPPYATSVGTLHPGERMIVRIARGVVNAYAPLVGQRRDVFTVDAFAEPNSSPPAPRIRPVRNGIEIDAPALESLLVRVPKGVDLIVLSQSGDVNATDISGTATVQLGDGNADLMLPNYGQVRDLHGGTVKVLVGSGDWPGTLRFFNASGDLNLSINENAKFHVHLHTGDGTIFTDFPLRGVSRGTSETVDGNVNGGASRGVDVEVGSGTIRLLSLAPQY